MKVIIARDAVEMADFAARFTVHLIRSRERVNLALATGNTMVNFYRAMVNLYNEGKVSFQDCTTFNLDEYVGIPEDHPASFHRYMRENFLDFVDLPSAQAFIPNGNAKYIIEEAQSYEDRIREKGGLDMVLAGIGVNGHIAFNEPGSSLASRTRVKGLSEETRRVNAKTFEGLVDMVPTHVITMGVGTVMDAHFVMLLASRLSKADAIAATVEGPITAMCPASILQMHPHAFMVVDRDAASRLSGSYQLVSEALGDPFEEYFWGV